MDVHLDLDEGLLDETHASFDLIIYKSIKKLLALPKIKRITGSHSSLEPSQLLGSIDAGKALEDPYGVKQDKINGGGFYGLIPYR